MVTTSVDFKTAIKAPSRKILGRMSFPYDAINEKTIQSVELESNLAFDDFTIGIAAMSMASVELEEDLYEGLTVSSDLSGKTCNIEIGIMLPNGSMEYVSMGLFTVESFEREQTKIRMKLVDRMHLADRQYDRNNNVTTVGMPIWVMETLSFEELELKSFEDFDTGIIQIMAPPVYPTTLFEIAKHAALQCGLLLDTASWPNSDYIVEIEPVYEGISCRQILAQIAELAGGYALINRAGNVEIRTLGNIPSTELTNADMFSYKEHEGNTGTIERVIVKIGDEQASQGDGENIYTVVDNIFVQNPNNVINALYNSLRSVNYQAIESIEWSGDFSLDMGDVIDVNGKMTYLLNRVIKLSGGLVETFSAPVKSNVERNSTGKNNTQLEINKVKTEIKVVSGEIDQVISDTNGKFTQINQTIDGINQSVSDKADRADITILANQIEQKVTQQQVQDMIDEVNRANPNLITNLSENWEQGTIGSSDGELADSTGHIRVKAYYPIRQGHVYIKVSPLYQAMIILYNSAYGFKASYGFATEQTFLLDENCYFKIVLRRTNLTAITPDAINTAELKVENSNTPTVYTPYYGDLTLEQQQDYFTLEVNSDNGWTIDSDSFTATFTAKVYLFNEDITSRFQPLQFTWYKQYPGGELISLGNGTTKIIAGSSIEKSATISCSFEIYDTIYTLSTYNGDTLLTKANEELMVIGYV